MTRMFAVVRGALRFASGSPLAFTAGPPGLRFHDFRSLAAIALVAAGVDVKTAQTRFGHSSPTVTLGIYARATDKADRLAAEAVGTYLAPSRMADNNGECSRNSRAPSFCR